MPPFGHITEKMQVTLWATTRKRKERCYVTSIFYSLLLGMLFLLLQIRTHAREKEFGTSVSDDLNICSVIFVSLLFYFFFFRQECGGNCIAWALWMRLPFVISSFLWTTDSSIPRRDSSCVDCRVGDKKWDSLLWRYRIRVKLDCNRTLWCS